MRKKARLAACAPFARLVLALVLTLPLSGCGTLITLIDGPQDFDGNEIAHSYSGIRLSWGGSRKSEVAFVFAIDLPLSFVGDTLLLPIRALQDAYALVRRRTAEPPLEPEAG